MLENRSRPRPYKVVTVRCGYKEDQDAAWERHRSFHPEDQDADVVILQFHNDDETSNENTHDCAQVGPARDKP